MIWLTTAFGAALLIGALLVFVWNIAGETEKVPEGLPFWKETAWRYAAMLARYPWVPVVAILAAPLITLNIMAGQRGYGGWIEMVRAWVSGS